MQKDTNKLNNWEQEFDEKMKVLDPYFYRPPLTKKARASIRIIPLKEQIKSFIKEKLITAHNEGREEVREQILTAKLGNCSRDYADGFTACQTLALHPLSPNKDKSLEEKVVDGAKRAVKEYPNVFKRLK